MRSLFSRSLLTASIALASIALAAAWSGCSVDPGASDSPDPEPIDGGVSDTRIQEVNVRDDAGATAALCGEDQLCDPDIAAICTPISSDGGVDDGVADEDSETDGSTASTTNACRVVEREQRVIAACAPAGEVAESQFCESDGDCAPGLTCVGRPGLTRCLRFCCTAWAQPPQGSSDAGSATHYCTPQPLAERPTQLVPVWVKLDNCTLLDDELQCPKDTTCTVVTNDGRTTCVLAGTGRDYASCAEEPCDQGYVCLGTGDRQCRKLCRESDGSAACPTGSYCQRVPTIPEGFGICAGGESGR
jgi:hypothetical protein